MAITKADISQIKGVVRSEVDNLARIVAKGFEQVDKRFEQVDKRFDSLEARIAHLDARVAMIERDVAEIRKSLISRMELEDLMARIKYVELKLGIKSGK